MANSSGPRPSAPLAGVGVRTRATVAAVLVVAVALGLGLAAVVLVGLVGRTIRESVTTAVQSRAEQVAADVAARPGAVDLGSGEDGILVQLATSDGVLAASPGLSGSRRCPRRTRPRGRSCAPRSTVASWARALTATAWSRSGCPAGLAWTG